MRSQVPSVRQRRYQVWTVLQGGKSCGSSRHWQPRADQVEDGVEDFAQVGGWPPGALGTWQERFEQGELLVGEVGVIALGSHNPLYAHSFGFSHSH